jgi:hypothetical protein
MFDGHHPKIVEVNSKAIGVGGKQGVPREGNLQGKTETVAALSGQSRIHFVDGPKIDR